MSVGRCGGRNSLAHEGKTEPASVRRLSSLFCYPGRGGSHWITLMFPHIRHLTHPLIKTYLFAPVLRLTSTCTFNKRHICCLVLFIYSWFDWFYKYLWDILGVLFNLISPNWRWHKMDPSCDTTWLLRLYCVFWRKLRHFYRTHKGSQN